MRAESNYFAHWIGMQESASILPSQVNAVVNILERLNTGDLISVAFNGEDEGALKALKMLRQRFEDEMYELDRMSQDQGRGYD
jgi:hypothetical protein